MDNFYNKDPKERILEVSVELFAEKGYSAVGVREIVTKAGVNISMISYYFGSKIGILKEIIEKYFNSLEEVIRKTPMGATPEDTLRTFIKNIFGLMAENKNLSKLAITVMPFYEPEIEEIKIKVVSKFLQMTKDAFHTLEGSTGDSQIRAIVGSAFMSLLFSNFIFGQMIQTMFDTYNDDTFDDKYAEIISTIFLKGVGGIAADARIMMPHHN